MIKYSDLLNYIMDHPRLSKVLKDWDEVSITKAIYESNMVNGLVYYKSQSRIEGVVIAFPDGNTKRIWVTAMICDTKEALKYFFEMLRKLYPDYKLAARRHGRVIIYGGNKTQRLCNAILNS